MVLGASGDLPKRRFNIKIYPRWKGEQGICWRSLLVSGLYGMFFAHVSPVEDRVENKLMLQFLAATFVNLGIGGVSKKNLTGDCMEQIRW